VISNLIKPRFQIENHLLCHFCIKPRRPRPSITLSVDHPKNMMASSVAIMAAMLYASTVIALPQPIIEGISSPGNVAVTWYQAPLAFTEAISTDTTCGWAVSTGQLKTTQCYVLHTYALGLQQNEHHACALKVWNSVSDCSGNGTWTMHAIPSGNDTSCVETGVLDGGNFQHKSCVLTCS
jgi:hypothetical protein